MDTNGADQLHPRRADRCYPAVCFRGRTRLDGVRELPAHPLSRGHAGLGVSRPFCRADGGLSTQSTMGHPFLQPSFLADTAGAAGHVVQLSGWGVHAGIHCFFHPACSTGRYIHLSLFKGSAAVSSFRPFFPPPGAGCAFISGFIFCRYSRHRADHCPGRQRDDLVLYGRTVFPPLSVQRLVPFCRAGAVLSGAGAK